MKIDIYSLEDIQEMLFPHDKEFIEYALFEVFSFERFIHVDEDILESMISEYGEDYKNKANSNVWIDILNDLIIMIQEDKLPKHFMIDFYNDLNIYK